MDPYRPPEQLGSVLPVAKRPKKSFGRLLFMVMSVFSVGYVFSGIGAEYFKCVGDPDGKGIAFGIGGLFGLCISILALILWKQVQSSRRDENSRE